jgi:hypothetical protein
MNCAIGEFTRRVIDLRGGRECNLFEQPSHGFLLSSSYAVVVNPSSTGITAPQTKPLARDLPTDLPDRYSGGAPGERQAESRERAARLKPVAGAAAGHATATNPA